MFRIIVFLLIVLALGLMFAWVADNPGTIFVQWEWLAEKLGRWQQRLDDSNKAAMQARLDRYGISIYNMNDGSPASRSSW